jgi:hypothetical protein
MRGIVSRLGPWPISGKPKIEFSYGLGQKRRKGSNLQHSMMRV